MRCSYGWIIEHRDFGFPSQENLFFFVCRLWLPRRRFSPKKTDLLVDLEFLFVASRSAVETHSVHRNVGHLFWRNLHLQEAAAEEKQRMRAKQGEKAEFTTSQYKRRRTPRQRPWTSVTTDPTHADFMSKAGETHEPHTKDNKTHTNHNHLYGTDSHTQHGLEKQRRQRCQQSSSALGVRMAVGKN